VRGISASRMYDADNMTWTEVGRSEGEAWMQAGDKRQVRAEVSHGQTRPDSSAVPILGPTQFGSVQDASYVETWDGTTVLRQYQPPFSTVEAETSDRRQLKGEGLLGTEFSMQLPWDEESEADLQGMRKTIDRNPLDPAVLAKQTLSARRVVLGTGTEAMELTVDIVDVPNNGGIVRTEIFWFDPRRGYGLLARQNVLSSGGTNLRKQTLVVESMVEAAPGVFYPAQAVMLWEEGGNPFMWEEFAASKVTANETLDVPAFKLEFPQGIRVMDYKNGIGKVRE
jgi:hypothetical protein